MRPIRFKKQIFCHNEIKNGCGLESCEIYSGMLCERIEIMIKVNGWGFTFGDDPTESWCLSCLKKEEKSSIWPGVPERRI